MKLATINGSPSVVEILNSNIPVCDICLGKAKIVWQMLLLKLFLYPTLPISIRLKGIFRSVKFASRNDFLWLLGFYIETTLFVSYAQLKSMLLFYVILYQTLPMQMSLKAVLTLVMFTSKCF